MALDSVKLRSQFWIFHAVEATTAHVPATSGSFADAAFLSVNVQSLAASAMVPRRAKNWRVLVPIEYVNYGPVEWQPLKQSFVRKEVSLWEVVCPVHGPVRQKMEPVSGKIRVQLVPRAEVNRGPIAVVDKLNSARKVPT